MPDFAAPDLVEMGNSEWWKFSPSPGGNGTSTARDLARFYGVLVGGGAFGNDRWLSPDTIADVTASHAEGVERASGHDFRLGLGVQLSTGGPNRYGDDPSPRVFGHGGAGTCVAWGDPDLNAGVAVITTGMQPDEINNTRLQYFSQLVRDALAG